MSYILEALKKAQAERALGSAPTLHAMPLHPTVPPTNRSGAASLWVGLLVGLLVAGAAWMVWRSSDSDTKPQPVQTAAAAAAPAPKLAPMPAMPNKPEAAATVAPMPATLPAPTSAATAPTPAVAPPVRAPSNTPEPAAVLAQAPAAAPAPPEEILPTLRELPEAIARAVPPVSIGGYIYTKNPADRLLLVDKVLRHEGEELAPGLVLEKLLPKAAVMNYKGYRYKVAY
jgi:general secretion pathway protein B